MLVFGIFLNVSHKMRYSLASPGCGDSYEYPLYMILLELTKYTIP